MKETNNSDTSDTLIFGSRPVLEALLAGKSIDKIIVKKQHDLPIVKEIKLQAKARGIYVQEVPAEKFHFLKNKNHQYVAAWLAEVEFTSVDILVPQLLSEGILPVLVILDRVTDVRNFGSIVRTAECLGAHAVVIPKKGSASVNSDAMKASAGALARLPICRENNLRDTLRFLNESGFSTIACTEKANQSLYNTEVKLPFALLMGNEENGIATDLRKLCSVEVKIPMQGATASLNVAVATGIALSALLQPYQH
ncbi:MAG: 23S rRNA (guanosine(2251)-2'-O)-methyltransferase RlmB [Thermaurantimonas sp.]|uniref:23S rRNA (guanosine(2251)-2'-O)-methyltransferase RlmB n=1 Tax=Thermaurantimonas sp. TaxID=2681568 RepID=UPI00391BE557